MEKTTIAMILLILLAFSLSIYFYPQMPEEMASHWNARGEVNGYMPKFWGSFLMPLMTLGMVGLFLVLPKIDPLKKNYSLFKNYYNGLVLVFIVFFFYIHAISIVANLGFAFNMSYLILPPMALLFLFIGYILPRCKRNWFVGIKTPWTLSSDNIWNKTHKLGGKLFMIYGAFILAMMLFYDTVVEYFAWIIIGPVLTLSAFLFIYSYYEYWKETVKR